MADDQHDDAGDEIPGDGGEATAATAGAAANGSSPHGRPRTGWERLSDTFLRPAKPAGSRKEPEKVDFSSMSDDEKRSRISSIDPTERKIGLAASILAAVFALVYSIPYMVSKIAVPTTVKPVHGTCATTLTYVASSKTCNGVYPPSHYVLPLVLWLVFAAAILVTVRIGRRSPLAFAMVLTGLAFGTLILMIPFVAAGAWVLIRAYKTQKYGAPNAKAPLEGYVRPPPRTRGSGGRGGTGAGKSAGGGSARNSTRRRRKGEPEPEPDVRPPPTASKRYTPKSPPKKRVPPPS